MPTFTMRDFPSLPEVKIARLPVPDRLSHQLGARTSLAGSRSRRTACDHPGKSDDQAQSRPRAPPRWMRRRSPRHASLPDQASRDRPSGGAKVSISPTMIATAAPAKHQTKGRLIAPFLTDRIPLPRLRRQVRPLEKSRRPAVQFIRSRTDRLFRPFSWTVGQRPYIGLPERHVPRRDQGARTTSGHKDRDRRRRGIRLTSYRRTSLSGSVPIDRHERRMSGPNSSACANALG